MRWGEEGRTRGRGTAAVVAAASPVGTTTAAGVAASASSGGRRRVVAELTVRPEALPAASRAARLTLCAHHSEPGWRSRAGARSGADCGCVAPSRWERTAGNPRRPSLESIVTGCSTEQTAGKNSKRGSQTRLVHSALTGWRSGTIVMGARSVPLLNKHRPRVCSTRPKRRTLTALRLRRVKPAQHGATRHRRVMC